MPFGGFAIRHTLLGLPLAIQMQGERCPGGGAGVVHRGRVAVKSRYRCVTDFPLVAIVFGGRGNHASASWREGRSVLAIDALMAGNWSRRQTRVMPIRPMGS